MRQPPSRLRLLALLALAAAAAPAGAQILGGGGPPLGGAAMPPSLPMGPPAGLPATPPRGGDLAPPGAPPALPDPAAARAREAVGDLGRDVSRAPAQLGRQAAGALARSAQAAADAAAPLTQTYAQAAARMLQAHPEALEADERGAPVVRGEILAIGSSPAVLARARQAGFGGRVTESLPGLGLSTATLRVPAGLSAPEALRRLKALDPEGQYDLNHVYLESGVVAGPALRPSAAPAWTQAPGAGVRVGLVDGSAAAGHPALRGARLVQRAFAPGGARVSAHATAIASLLAGRDRGFRGAAPGATVMVADVYGPTPAGGSAAAIARGLSWLAEAQVPVIDISLVGPPNALLGAAVKALVQRGRLIVAAVGNDGPAAPPLYPAAYPGVVAVTGVDARRQVLPEAGRGSHVDFAAPGAQMAAASPGGAYVAVRGTSFAAPIVAGQLAALAPRASAGQAVAQLGRRAADLGAPGPDPVYGRGLVGFELRTEPAALGAPALALRDR